MPSFFLSTAVFFKTPPPFSLVLQALKLAPQCYGSSVGAQFFLLRSNQRPRMLGELFVGAQDSPSRLGYGRSISRRMRSPRGILRAID